ncbi:MAG: homoserine dehydrogenase [Tissierellales bacterium]|nr:homoserine dehydrogenase [Tissierellales bacterium]
MINIGLLGFGTVGIGVYNMIMERKDYLELILKNQINIKKILVKNLNKDRKVTVKPDILTIDEDDIFLDEEIDIIIELTPSIDDAYRYAKKALSQNKHFITSNKALVSAYYEELSTLFEDKNLKFLYEASVGGAIPIIRELKIQIKLNEVTNIRAILNGTTNYILSNIYEKNISFYEALKRAQELGYAEQNPSDDIDAIDSKRKIRILSTLGFGTSIVEDDILFHGIGNISSYDINIFKERGLKVKLIANANAFNGKYEVSVFPTAIGAKDIFYNIDYRKNIISFTGDKVGELSFIGEGAGMYETANSVLSDLIETILDKDFSNPLRARGFENSITNFKGIFYLRMSNEKINIPKEYIKEIISEEKPFVIITNEINILDLIEYIKEIKNEDYSIIKVEE